MNATQSPTAVQCMQSLLNTLTDTPVRALHKSCIRIRKLFITVNTNQTFGQQFDIILIAFCIQMIGRNGKNDQVYITL